MRKIIKILAVEKNKRFTRTHALLDDGSEVTGYGTDFKVGDLVQSFWHEKWQTHKIRKPVDKPLI